MKKHIFRSSRYSSNLRFPREQGFFDKSFLIRLFISLIFAGLLFLMAHFRETMVVQLEPDTSSKQFVVAPLNFEFYDEEATIILQQEASRDIGNIYQIDESQVRLRRVDFEKYLIFNQDWRKYTEYSAFDELYRGVEDVEKALLKLRFIDVESYQKMRQEKLDIRNYIVLPSGDEKAKALIFPDRIWDKISETAFMGDLFQQTTMDFIIEYFKKEVWVLENNKDNRRVIRKVIQLNVPRQYSLIKAGDAIIKPGDIVTHDHLGIVRAMKVAVRKARNLDHLSNIAGSCLLVIFLMFMGALYLRTRFHDILISNRKLFLLYIIIGIAFVFAKTGEYMLLSLPPNLYSYVRFPVFVPLMSILLCNLMNMELAIVLSCFIIMFFSKVLVLGDSFMQVNLAACLGALLSLKPLRNRRRILSVSVRAWFFAIIMITSISLYRVGFSFNSLMVDYAVTFGFMFFISILVIGVLPVIETIFPIMTDAVLMEYMDPNNEILSRLAMEAPGTYQHSIVVGTLAEAAAQAIRANSLFCRVSAMYHDIGKLRNPNYFIENQNQGANMHHLLTPVESAKVIIDHVSEGVAMARKAGLPEQFIDIIKEHHGDTIVQYFYCKQLEKKEGIKENVNRGSFQYSGPRPRSKEAAILMIADSFEAASRSLEEVSEASVKKLINEIVKNKADQGQFDECMLTFEELGIVRKVLVKTMITAAHSRIKYQTLKN